MSTILRDVRRRISRKPLELEAWFQRITNRKWRTGWVIKWSSNRWRHVTLKGQTRDNNTLERNISKTAGFRYSIPKDYRKLPMTSRDPKGEVLWSSTVGYPSDSLASCYLYSSMRMITCCPLVLLFSLFAAYGMQVLWLCPSVPDGIVIT